MLTEMNAAVQALVWTTLAGLLYAVWLHSLDTGQGPASSLSHQWRYVVRLLQTMWTLFAISVILILLLFTFPRLFDFARSAPPTCIQSAPSTLTLADGDSSTTLACTQVNTVSR